MRTDDAAVTNECPILASIKAFFCFILFFFFCKAVAVVVSSV